MAFARVLVEECKPGAVEALARGAEESLVPSLQGIPGFISYKIVKVSERSLIAMNFCETLAAVEETERLAAGWRDQYKDAILSARPYVGEIIVDVAPAQPELHAGY